jgi:hypothetical protein
LLLDAACAATGCDDNPTPADVEPDYATADDASAPAATITVFKTWWVTTLFPSPVLPGAESETERTIPGTDFAYALIAPGWTADSGQPPARLVALKSAQTLTATEHHLLSITISDATFNGNCAAGSVLDGDDARLIVERIFPGEFAGLTYDPATCTATPTTATDAGATDGAGIDGASD